MEYSIQHMWVQSVGEKRVRVGLSTVAQCEFGEIVFVELPEVGARVAIGEPCGNIESVKTVTELASPVAGEVLATNAALVSNLTPLNEDAEGTGWLFEVALEAKADGLLTAAQYGEMYQK
jgi:glycine cleavage system H protein